MRGRIRTTKLLIAASIAAIGALTVAGSAFAGTANYPSTATFGVPNNTGQAGVPSQVFVPPGRTPVQSVQLTNVMPSFGGGGGQDLQLRLKSPNGPDIHILNLGCTTYPNTSAFTISDTATLSVDTPAFCTALAGAPTTTSGKPSEPLSAFNGQPSGGTWTVTVVDVGISATLGSWNGWTLQINHANPTVTASPAPFKIKGKFALSATCDANCSVTTGGAAAATTTQLAANSPGIIVAPRRRRQEEGQGRRDADGDRPTGGTGRPPSTRRPSRRSPRSSET
jgi:hypothetical protein